MSQRRDTVSWKTTKILSNLICKSVWTRDPSYHPEHIECSLPCVWSLKLEFSIPVFLVRLYHQFLLKTLNLGTFQFPSEGIYLLLMYHHFPLKQGYKAGFSPMLLSLEGSSVATWCRTRNAVMAEVSVCYFISQWYGGGTISSPITASFYHTAHGHSCYSCRLAIPLIVFWSNGYI